MFEEAYKRVAHCGPEKRIAFVPYGPAEREADLPPNLRELRARFPDSALLHRLFAHYLAGDATLAELTREVPLRLAEENQARPRRFCPDRNEETAGRGSSRLRPRRRR